MQPGAGLFATQSQKLRSGGGGGGMVRENELLAFQRQSRKELDKKIIKKLYVQVGIYKEIIFCLIIC